MALYKFATYFYGILSISSLMIIICCGAIGHFNQVLIILLLILRWFRWAIIVFVTNFQWVVRHWKPQWECNKSDWCYIWRASLCLKTVCIYDHLFAAYIDDLIAHDSHDIGCTFHHVNVSIILYADILLLAPSVQALRTWSCN